MCALMDALESEHGVLLEGLWPHVAGEVALLQILRGATATLARRRIGSPPRFGSAPRCTTLTPRAPICARR